MAIPSALCPAVEDGEAAREADEARASSIEASSSGRNRSKRRRTEEVWTKNRGVLKGEITIQVETSWRNQITKCYDYHGVSSGFQHNLFCRQSFCNEKAEWKKNIFNHLAE